MSLPCFPQLKTGAMAQFPIRKRRVNRTVVNETEDGRQVKWLDAGAAGSEWNLTFEGIDDSERASLETFFTQMEGRLNSFRFLDPTSNLVEWTEDLSQTVWQTNPYLRLTGGGADPYGTHRGTWIQNTSDGAARLQQTLNAPGNYVYCLSVSVRAGAACQIRLFRTSGSSEDAESFDIAPDWRRLSTAGALSSSEDSIAFGIEIPGGTTVGVFGFQVEAQPSASTYKQSLAGSGVHENARFLDDYLEMTATGPGQHSAGIRVRSPL